MSLTILPAPAPTPSHALRAAQGLVSSSADLLSCTEATRAHASRLLWGAPVVNRTTGLPEVRRLAAPNDILNEIAEADQVKLMLGDVAARLLLSIKSDNPVAAFVASSPVPATDLVVFRDAAGVEVDLAPELAALLAKMVSVKAVEVSAV